MVNSDTEKRDAFDEPSVTRVMLEELKYEKKPEEEKKVEEKKVEEPPEVVADNWEDLLEEISEEEKQKEEKTPQPPPKQPPASKTAGKKKKKKGKNAFVEEEKENEEEDEDEEEFIDAEEGEDDEIDMLNAKLRAQRLVEEADMALADDLFGGCERPQNLEKTSLPKKIVKKKKEASSAAQSKEPLDYFPFGNLKELETFATKLCEAIRKTNVKSVAWSRFLEVLLRDMAPKMDSKDLATLGNKVSSFIQHKRTLSTANKNKNNSMAWFIIWTLYLLFWFCQVGGQSDNVSDCECVPFYLCINGTINTNGVGVIDIRMGDNECASYLEMCCKKDEIVDVPLTRAPIRKKKKLGCGYRNPNGVGYRITGDSDNEAQFGEFPWMVAIMHKGENEPEHKYKCGGSLIHPQVVLTAAHCILGGHSFRVRAGEWDSRTTQEIYKHQERKVIGGVAHRNFNRRNLANDVALLFLDTPVELSSHINVACLPPLNSVVLSEECFVTGWGRDKFEKVETHQNILKKIEVPMMSHEECESAFRRTRLGRYFNLHRSFNCAGGEEGKDACIGDGGGPLVCPIPGQEDRYQQVGIVSWGIGCGTKDVPGAYGNVAHLRYWIDEQMNKRNFNSSTYRF